MPTTTHFRIQYASDFHLELYDVPPSYETLLTPSAPNLVLAGDIGHPKHLAAFLTWAAPRWDTILYVAGNHEYYWLGGGAKQTMAERQAEIREIVGRFGNVHFLEAGTVEGMSYYDAATNTAVIGCTMWTQTGPGARRHTNDYRRIPNITLSERNENVTPSSLNAIHSAEVAALRTAIRVWTARGARICVVTHHMPSFRLIHPVYAGLDGNDCFAAHMDDLFGCGNVHTWIYGHTHVSGERVLGATRCCVNSRGYADEKRVGAPYRVDAVVSVGDMTISPHGCGDEEACEPCEFL